MFALGNCIYFEQLYYFGYRMERLSLLKSQLRPTRKVFVNKIQVNPVHTILKYGNYYDFMDR